MSRGSGTEGAVGLPSGYLLRPSLLLLLTDREGHGYDLLQRLLGLGLSSVDPGGMYRCLRAMDQENLVRSTWEPSREGPARRTYHLTAEGRAALAVWMETLGAVGALVGQMLDRYEQQDEARRA